MNHPRIVVVGSLNMDIVVQTNRYPKPGETILGNNVQFIPGGKGANQAVAAARLGAQVSMIGAVGEDAFGQELLQSLQKDGIHTAGVSQMAGFSTGIASIYLAEDDNSIVVIPGANYQVTPAHMDKNEELFAQADIVLLQLEIPVETVLYAAKKAKKYGKLVVLNPAPAQKLPEEIFTYVDYITPNETELSWYTDMKTEGEQLQEAMKRMLEMGVPNVVTTLGSEGSAVLTAGADLKKIKGYKVEVVDTTGAGDSYNAALAYSVASGQSLDEAVRFAAQVSALAVTKFGAQTGMPTLQEVQAFAAQTKSS